MVSPNRRNQAIKYSSLNRHEREKYIASLSFEQKMQILTMIHNHYMMDIEQIWKRSTVFLLLSSALLAIIFSKEGISDPSYKLYFSILGLLTSIIWFFVSWTSSEWIKTWRERFVEVEECTNPFLSFFEGEGKDSRLKNLLYRPQFYANVLAASSVIAWSVIMISHFGFVADRQRESLPSAEQVQNADVALPAAKQSPPPKSKQRP